jgi:pyrroline-5-carboxylate reductase
MHALQQWLGEDVAIVRCMPNTPSLIGEGMTGAFANSFVSESQKIAASTILSTIGKWLWLIDEKYMDAVTALSGCGPAYFFLVMEALIKAGEQLGLSHDDARTLTLQTALGAAHMAIASTEDAAQLRQQVMSPGGVTEKAIHVFESGGLQSLFSGALHAAHQRAKELAVEFCE